MYPIKKRKYVWGDLIEPTKSSEQKTGDQVDQVGTSVASAFGPWWGALAKLGTSTSKSVQGDGTNLRKDKIGAMLDPFANVKGLFNGHPLEALPIYGQLLAGKRVHKEAMQRKAQIPGMLEGQSQGILAQYPTFGIPQGKYGMRILNFGRFTNPNYYSGVHSRIGKYCNGGRMYDNGGELEKFQNATPLFKQGGKYSWKWNPSEYPTNWALGGNLPQVTDNSDQKQIASDMAIYNGATHEGGGIDLDTNKDGKQDIEVENNEVIKDDMVLSDRMEPSDIIKQQLRHLGVYKQQGDSFASYAERLGKKKGEWEKKLDSHLLGESTAAQKMVAKYDKAVNDLFDDQQAQKQEDMVGQYHKKGGRFHTISIPSTDERYIRNNMEIVSEKPHDDYSLEQFKKGGHWIQKAINPKHKGYCTPMTKSTCTGRRRALALTFKKHHGFHKHGLGGLIDIPERAYGGQVSTDDQYASPYFYEDNHVKGFNPNGGNRTLYSKGGDFLNDNYGEIASVVGGIGNQLAIGQLKTDFQPNYTPTPLNPYTDRTNYITNQGQSQFRALTQGLNYGSQQENSGVKANLYAKTLGVTNDQLNQEQSRKDALQSHYQQMLQYNNFFNTQQGNAAKQLSMENRNQKVALGQQNWNNTVQSMIGNKTQKELRDLDLAKTFLYSTMQGGTGVSDRLLESLPADIRRKYFGKYKGIRTPSQKDITNILNSD